MADETALPTTRRSFLIGAGGLAFVTVLPREGRATPEAMKAAIKKVIGDAPLRKGKVRLDVPPIVENGNSVTLEVSVDSPMTAGDHVKATLVFEKAGKIDLEYDVRAMGAAPGKDMPGMQMPGH